MSETYERDFYAWANEQAALLVAGRLGGRLAILLVHLPNWQFQPHRQGNSWRLSIANNRDKLSSYLDDNPSLKANLPAAVTEGYRYARRDAARQTKLDEATFPTICPWSVEQVMDPDFWPL